MFQTSEMRRALYIHLNRYLKTSTLFFLFLSVWNIETLLPAMKCSYNITEFSINHYFDDEKMGRRERVRRGRERGEGKRERRGGERGREGRGGERGRGGEGRREGRREERRGEERGEGRREERRGEGRGEGRGGERGQKEIPDCSLL